jgi:hypothetical protein
MVAAYASPCVCTKSFIFNFENASHRSWLSTNQLINHLNSDGIGDLVARTHSFPVSTSSLKGDGTAQPH